MHCNTCSPSPKLKELSPISNDDYYRIPGADTITSVPGFNLLPFNIVVSTKLKAAICLGCSLPILPPSSIPNHVQHHLPAMVVPLPLLELLVEQFDLDDQVHYPPVITEPIYGIPLIEKPLLFCVGCNKGYHNLDDLRAHQSSNHCPQGHQVGYGQLIAGIRRRIIQVKVDDLVKKASLDIDYPSLFRQNSLPCPNYSRLPISVPENESNLSAFYRQDTWLAHIEGHTPENLIDACRTHSNDDSLGAVLRGLAQRYLEQIQPKIQENVNYGLLKNIGTTNACVYKFSLFNFLTFIQRFQRKNFIFRVLKETSVTKYFLVLHRLIFTCIRYYVGKEWTSTYQYPPIDDGQRLALQKLYNAIENESLLPELDNLYHSTCFALFAHQKHQYNASFDL